MRHILFTLCFVVSSWSFGQAWSIGPELGVNLTPMKADTLGQSLAPGWFGGLNAEYKINDYLSARAGIYFTQKQKRFSEYDSSYFELPIEGFEIEDILGESVDLNTFSETHTRVSQYYFEIPLMISANYKQVGVFAGPYLGYNFTTRERVEESSYTPWVAVLDVETIIEQVDPEGEFGSLISAFLPQERTYDFDIKRSSKYARLDFGFKFGIRYQEGPFGVNAFYSLGMLDYRGTSSGKRQTHNYFRASINYNFPLGKKKEASKGRMD